MVSKVITAVAEGVAKAGPETPKVRLQGLSR